MSFFFFFRVAKNNIFQYLNGKEICRYIIPLNKELNLYFESKVAKEVVQLILFNDFGSFSLKQNSKNYAKFIANIKLKYQGKQLIKKVYNLYNEWLTHFPNQATPSHFVYKNKKPFNFFFFHFTADK